MPSTRARSQLFQSNWVKIEDIYITKNGTQGDGATGDVIETDGAGNLRWVAKTQFNLGDLADFNAAGDTGQVLTLQSDDSFAMEWYSWDDLTDKPTNISTWTNDSGYITGYTVTESDVTAHQAALSITESQISDLQSYLTSAAFSDLTDVDTSSATAGQILTKQSDGTVAFDWVDVTLDPDARVQTLDFIDSTETVKATMSWNDIDGTVDVAYDGVTLQLGQEQHFYAKATEAIADGDVVMFAGAQGDHLLIAKADLSDSTFVPEYIIGVATQAFATNDFGYVTSFGKVRELDTTAWQDGTILYADPDTPGGLTSTIPSPPDHIIQMCAVTNSHQQQGTIFVRPTHKPDTDEVPEGSTNLYFTDDRVKAILSALDRSIVPATDSLYNLGSGAKKWANLYVDDVDAGNIDVSSNLTVQNLTLNATGTITGIDLNDLGDVDTAGSSTGQVLTKQSDGTFEFDNIPAVSWNNVQDKPTLPDYSQGTWTPVPKDASNNQGTSSGPQGKYVRIGNQVTVWCDVTNIDTSLLTSTNQLRIYTLPYNCNADVKAVGLAQITGLASSVPDGTIYAQVAEGTNYVTFKVMGPSTDYTIKVQDFDDDVSDIFGFTLTYYTTESV